MAAEQARAGTVLMGTSSIWPFHPEKCLAVREDWALANPEALTRLLRALMRAQRICDQPEEADAVVSLLADPSVLGLPREALRAALMGGHDHEQIHFHGAGAAFPAPPHAAWFLNQMRRWGWLDDAADLNAMVRQVYRPDLFALAARVEDLFTPVGLGHDTAVFKAFESKPTAETGTSDS